MDILESSPINRLIKTISNKKSKNNDSSPITFNDLAQELDRKNSDGKPCYNIDFKDDNKLAIFYYNDSPYNCNKKSDNSNDKDEAQTKIDCRSYIVEKSTLRPIGSQFNKIVYNDEAESILSKHDWSKVTVQKCYEGTNLLVYNYSNPS